MIRCGILDKRLAYKPVFTGSIHSFTSLSDENLSHASSPNDFNCLWKVRHNCNNKEGYYSIDIPILLFKIATVHTGNTYQFCANGNLQIETNLATHC